MINRQHVTVVLPAYNAAKTLERTLSLVDRSIVDDVIVVDDRSTDQTREIARHLGVRYAFHRENLGYGANQKTCYSLALATGADIVVMLHPDYQYEPRLLPSLAHMIASGVYDVAIASRILGHGALQGGMPKWKLRLESRAHPCRKHPDRTETVGVPYRLSGVLAPRARSAAALGQF